MDPDNNGIIDNVITSLMFVSLVLLEVFIEVEINVGDGVSVDAGTGVVVGVEVIV